MQILVPLGEEIKLKVADLNLFRTRGAFGLTLIKKTLFPAFKSPRPPAGQHSSIGH